MERINRIIGIVIIASFLLLFWAQALSGGQSNVRKIVVFHDSVISHAAQERIVKGAGGTMMKSLTLINGGAVLLPVQAIRALERHTAVLRVDSDIIVHATARKKPPKDDPAPEEPLPPQIMPWGVDRIDAEAVHPLGFTGAGINIGVIDTGIDYRHPDLTAAVKGGVNLINTRKGYMDDNGHGTHVAGIIAADDNDTGVVGVAPGASLYGIKALDRRGNGYLSDIIEGLGWALANGMDIVNMSLGTDSNILSFQDACDAATEAGLVLTAAAGNDGGAVDFPAAYGPVIAVAATSVDGSRPYWSSYGPEVFIAAPGVEIYSTWTGGDYRTASGTSMAAPHVAGTIALYLQAFSGEAVMSAICASADGSGITIYLGCGIVDAGEVLTGVSDFGNDLP